jgi:hypothetical protein
MTTRIWEQTIVDTKQTCNLPRDIVKYILECGKFKLRNGVWMPQISKKDQRYDVLRTIKPTRFYTRADIPISLITTTLGVFINNKYLCKIILYDIDRNDNYISYHINNIGTHIQ